MQDGTYLNGMSPFGYEKQESQLIPIEREAEIVRYIYSSFLVGVGTVQIAEELNRRYPKENGTWYVSAVRRILMNEKHIGMSTTKRTLPPMIFPCCARKTAVSFRSIMCRTITRRWSHDRNLKRCRPY
ncbi:MAG: recombinase family protein [Subdoligranulum sp.]